MVGGSDSDSSVSSIGTDDEMYQRPDIEKNKYIQKKFLNQQTQFVEL